MLKQSFAPWVAARALSMAAVLSVLGFTSASTWAQGIAHTQAEKIINQMRKALIACNDDQPVVLAPAGGSAGLLTVSARQAPVSAVQIAAANARPAVSFNPRLAQVAQGHSDSMAKEMFFEHDGMDGSTVATRAKRSGYQFRVISENIAAGQESLEETMIAWSKSQGHCENLVDPRVTEFGIALAKSKNPEDPYGSYWTLVFGRPK
jgi:uncharacterized protein YkwD